MSKIKAGDLYKIITIDDVSLEIRYGYYDEKEFFSKYNEPIPIFPDLIKNKLFTNKGFRLITHMQDKCIHYKGKQQNDSCCHCEYFEKKEDLIGLCKCISNKKGEVYEEN